MRRGIALVVLAAALAAGCGRKGPLRAPEDVQPAIISDLSASDTAAGIQLSWSRPRFYVDGERMSDLGGFTVERAVGSPAEMPFAPLARFEVSDRDRFRQISTFSHLDSDTTVGTLYRYRVVSFTVDGYVSAPSNVVTVERTAAAGSVEGEDTHGSFPTAPG